MTEQPNASSGNVQLPVSASGEAERPAETNLARVEEVLLTKLTSVSFSGPLPPPELLKAYDAVVPGAAKDMHELALTISRHKIELDRLAATASADGRRAEYDKFKRGQWMAFLLAAILIVSGTVCILKGHDGAGATIITTCLASLVLAFLWGKQSERKKAIRTAGKNREELEKER